MISRSLPIFIASVLLFALSLRRMLETCFLTVVSAINNFPAISRFDKPSFIKQRTLCSCLLRFELFTVLLQVCDEDRNIRLRKNPRTINKKAASIIKRSVNAR